MNFAILESYVKIYAYVVISFQRNSTRIYWTLFLDAQGLPRRKTQVPALKLHIIWSMCTRLGESPGKMRRWRKVRNGRTLE